MLTSLARVTLALEHREADFVPLDLGSMNTTGMHVDCVYDLRQALQLDPPGTSVKVNDAFTMLGEIAPTCKMRWAWTSSPSTSMAPFSASETRAGSPGPLSPARRYSYQRSSTRRPNPTATSCNIPRATRRHHPVAACPKAASTSTRSCGRIPSTTTTGTWRSSRITTLVRLFNECALTPAASTCLSRSPAPRARCCPLQDHSREEHGALPDGSERTVLRS